MLKDNFSQQAKIYARFRPLYPPELYEFIMSHVPLREHALDCATGNGQAASGLSSYFDHVDAFDISKKQLDQAPRLPNIRYLVSNEVHTPYPDNHFDLITVAAALHWLNFEKFFTEIKRVARDRAVFACWSYKVVRFSNDEIDAAIDDFYSRILKDYWDPERKHVDAEYKCIPFPFEEIANPGFVSKFKWTLSDLEGLLNSWSSVQHFIQREGFNPVDSFITHLKSRYKGQIFDAYFPIFMRIGFINRI